jgi:hypothetical protein
MYLTVKLKFTQLEDPLESEVKNDTEHRGIDSKKE